MSLSQQFGLQTGLRAILLMSVMLLLSFLLLQTDFIITPIVIAAVCAGLVAEFLFFVRRTNREVTRFFDSVRHADFSHRIDPGLYGEGFQELASSMRGVVERLQQFRQTGESERLQLRAIVEHVPVPMFGVINNTQVILHNHAARRFFGTEPVTCIEDLERFGPDLIHAIRHQQPGQSTLIRLVLDDGSSPRMTLSLTEIVVGQEHQRLVTLQNISDELAASELEAWQQMAQVLAHEIMNSLTPVASLADTAKNLLTKDDTASHQQAQEAIETVAERAARLMNFVQAYRRFSRLPAPRLERIDANKLLRAMTNLVQQEADANRIRLSTSINPVDLVLQADREQLEQVIINLLRNAFDAVNDSSEPWVVLKAHLNRRSRPVIEVHDNGSGVPEELRDRIFVPYYSTRKDGSGVGLALTRQVMAAHGGTASIGDSELGGARIMLQF
ncbi:MAG: ATP-binding protein [Pseudomonadota bacterium]